MENFVAIDFETANGNRSSVCSVGIAVVRDGEIVDKYYSLIQPTPNFYTRFTTAVHGLTMEDTGDARQFPQVWAEVSAHLPEDFPLVAHNSPFDESCLRAVFEAYDMDYPEYPFFCTCRASRRTFGGLLPNHQLHTVAERCGFHLEDHHHALADAEACAWIAREIL